MNSNEYNYNQSLASNYREDFRFNIANYLIATGGGGDNPNERTEDFAKIINQSLSGSTHDSLSTLTKTLSFSKQEDEKEIYCPRVKEFLFQKYITFKHGARNLYSSFIFPQELIKHTFILSLEIEFQIRQQMHKSRIVNRLEKIIAEQNYSNTLNLAYQDLQIQCLTTDSEAIENKFNSLFVEIEQRNYATNVNGLDFLIPTETKQDELIEDLNHESEDLVEDQVESKSDQESRCSIQ